MNISREEGAVKEKYLGKVPQPYTGKSDRENYSSSRWKRPTQDITPLSGISEEESEDLSKDTNQLNVVIVDTHFKDKHEDIFQRVPTTFRYIVSPTTNFTDEEKEKLYQNKKTTH